MKDTYDVVFVCKVEMDKALKAVEVARMMIEDENETNLFCFKNDVKKE